MGHLKMEILHIRATTRPSVPTGPTLRRWRKMRWSTTLTNLLRLFKRLSRLLGETPQMHSQRQSRQSMTTLGTLLRSPQTNCFWAPTMRATLRAKSCTLTRWSTPQGRSNEECNNTCFTVDINKRHTHNNMHTQVRLKCMRTIYIIHTRTKWWR